MQKTIQEKKRINYFVQFKFLPGLGFYGFGLIHMIGGLSRTATAALRQLVLPLRKFTMMIYWVEPFPNLYLQMI
jgi:hypothetical protein